MTAPIHGFVPPAKAGRLAVVIILIAILTSACTSFSPTGQAVHTFNTELGTGQTSGQTFTTTFGGLQSIAVWISPVDPGNGRLVFRLHASPGGTDPIIRETSIPLADIREARYYRFRFEPLPDPAFTDYFLTLEIEGIGKVQIGNGEGSEYADGAFYLDGSPRDAQLVFRPGYSPAWLARDLLRELMNWVLVLLAGLLLFILPGWGLAPLLLPGFTLSPWQTRAAVSAGISLALYPVLFLVCFLLGFQPGSMLAWLPAAFGISGLVYKRWSRHRGSVPKQILEKSNPRVGFSQVLHQIPFLLVLGAVIFTRFWVIRNLEMPMFGDSFQHSLITQLLLDHGGLFNTWLPYTDLTTFTYHFGFHTLAGVFAWVTRLPAAQSVLYTGQIINILAVFTIIPLALKIFPGRWTPLFTILVAGLFAPIPMDYTNWGRYPQLAGQVVLPVLIWLAWEIFDQKEWRWRSIFTLGIIFSGLALTHYRVLIFASVAFITVGIFAISRQGLKNILVKGFSVAAVALACFLPWFVHVYAGKILMILSSQLATPASQAGTLASQTNNAGSLLSYLPLGLWVWMGLVILIGLVRRNRSVWIITLWLALLALAANPGWLNLPGEGAITNFAVLIAFYIPAGVLCGASAGWLFDYALSKLPVVPGHKSLLRPVLLTIAIIPLAALIAWFSVIRVRDMQPDVYSMVTRADTRAAAWIHANLPGNAQFLVNAFPAFGDYTYAGSDAGWWLPVLTGHKTTLPPTNYGFEEGISPDYRTWINLFLKNVNELGVDHPLVLQGYQDRGVTHVFIGQKQGRVNAPPNYALDPNQLLASSHYRLVYHQDRVWIFEIINLPE